MYRLPWIVSRLPSKNIPQPHLHLPSAQQAEVRHKRVLDAGINFTALLDGGVNGTTSQNFTNGALPGEAGQVRTDLLLPEDTLPASDAGAGVGLQLVHPSCKSPQGGQISISAPSGTTYSLNGGPDQDAPVFDGLGAGTYTLTARFPGGCTADTLLLLTDPFPVRDSLLRREKQNCLHGGLLQIMAVSGQPPFEYQLDGGPWQNDGVFEDLRGGAYQVTIRDASGCTYTTSYSIEETAPVTMTLDSSAPTFCGQPEGAVTVSASGGSGPYSFSLQGQAARPDGLFSGLAPGLYSIVVTDTEGCTDQLDDLQIENMADTALVIKTDTIWKGVAYELPDGQRTERPDRYTYLFQTQAGCDSTYILDLVVLPRPVFVPNVFSPNGDGRNDYLTVYSDEKVLTIRQLAIYDRWGELVFQGSNFPTNDDAKGWDGMIRGRVAPPGAFIWIAELEFMDGWIERYQGDVTVVR